MKKILFLVAMVLPMVFVGCSETNEQKAQKLIKEHMMKNVHDASSYEVVEFGSLDSTFTNIMDDSKFHHAFVKRIICQKMRNQLYNETQLWRTIDKERYNHYKNRHDAYVDSTDMYYKQEQKAREQFVPMFNGYVMTHSFRANNEIGTPILNKVVIVFNKELTQIKSVNDWNEYQSIDIDENLKNLEKEMLNQ